MTMLSSPRMIDRKVSEFRMMFESMHYTPAPSALPVLRRDTEAGHKTLYRAASRTVKVVLYKQTFYQPSQACHSSPKGV